MIDSNFLVVPFEFKVDIFKEIPRVVGKQVDIVLLKPIYEEIERLSREGSPKTRKRMSSALELCRDKCRIKEFQLLEGETVDDLLARAAEDLKCPVATNDRRLRLRLRERRLPVIYLRQRSELKVDGWISQQSKDNASENCWLG